MNLADIQSYLQTHKIDGWLLYNFRDLNPIAMGVAGFARGGSRRWCLYIPAQGAPTWLVHAIESHMFMNAAPELKGELHRYASWQQWESMIPQLVGATPGRRLRIAMEYSPRNALPFISRVDAGMKELVEQSANAEIVSSADLAQMVLAVLTPQQLAGHRRAARICLDVKEAAFAHIGERLRNQQPITEYEAQQFVAQRFAAAGLDPALSIVSVNANAADPHYFPGEQHHSPIQVGDVVLIDLWNREKNSPDDCFADCTWTAFCGSHIPPKVQQVFDVVIAGRDRAVQFIQEQLDANTTVIGTAVDDACRQVIADAGYGDYFIHRTGHSLGPTGHYLGVNIDNYETQDARQLIPGIMFTIEPGIYMPDFNYDDSPTPKGLGILSEINCFMHDDSVEVTTLPLQTEMPALLG